MAKDEKEKTAGAQGDKGLIDLSAPAAPKPPDPPPVEEAPPAKGGKSVVIVLGSQVVGSGDRKRLVPKLATVASEKDITPEVLLKGAAKKTVKGANVYVTRDGKKLKFDAKSGALL